MVALENSWAAGQQVWAGSLPAATESIWRPWRLSSVLTPVNCLTAPKVWGLGNIAGDSTQLRDHVLSYNFVEKLAEMILQTLDQGGNKQLVRNATWTLSNCVRGKPRPPMEVARTALPLLARLIRVDDDETMADAAYVFHVDAFTLCQ